MTEFSAERKYFLLNKSYERINMPYSGSTHSMVCFRPTEKTGWKEILVGRYTHLSYYD